MPYGEAGHGAGDRTAAALSLQIPSLMLGPSSATAMQSHSSSPTAAAVQGVSFSEFREAPEAALMARQVSIPSRVANGPLLNLTVINCSSQPAKPCQIVNDITDGEIEYADIP